MIYNYKGTLYEFFSFKQLDLGATLAIQINNKQVVLTNGSNIKDGYAFFVFDYYFFKFLSLN